ncbi:FtsH protease activity modulator HflK [Parathalassolituus penaei]|uniref:Protein HflK n=1 Tax=Parathalassolituus penaei TaxID=2997323 RepID=A0A9X3ECM5_9GAMM|nr:FtsH protease activity modulator HflK [Parathalassolituus penaei]MCY0964195.1 FtsH protease activity modulator HflK [Parathalassolituus penaei]
MVWNEPGGNGNPNDPWGNNSNRGNNNRGNKGGGGQPPDLDEALKQLLDKLNGLFGNGGGRGNNNSNGGNDGETGMGGLLTMALAVLAVLGVYNSVYTLDESERGVVLRLGEYYATETPGLHWKIPLVDTVIPVNTTKVRESEVKQSMLTEDENIVEIEMSMQYKVVDPVAFALRVENPERTLVDAAESALRHEAGSAKMDQVLTDGRTLLAEQVKLRLQNYLDRYQTGIEINSVIPKDIRPPAEVKDAFDDVQKAKQDKERFINEAEAYSNAVIPEARGRAQRQLEEASAYKEQVVARAEGEAARFDELYAEYRKAPEVTRERLYIDAVSSVYTNSSKVLVDVDGGNNMMYLPLDKIMQSMPTPKTSGSALSSSDISRLTDQVLDEVRSRQSSASSTVRREGR